MLNFQLLICVILDTANKVGTSCVNLSSCICVKRLKLIKPLLGLRAWRSVTWQRFLFLKVPEMFQLEQSFVSQLKSE